MQFVITHGVWAASSEMEGPATEDAKHNGDAHLGQSSDGDGRGAR